MKEWQLAQLNIAELSAPIDSPELSGFVEQLDAINALADEAPGFVWRLQTEEGDATSAEHPFGDDMIVNMSVWENVEALHNYVYRTAHAKVMARRKEWFERMQSSYSVLWWVPAGHRPTVYEANERLARLREVGPTGHAFDFKHAYGPPEAERQTGLSFDDECPAL